MKECKITYDQLRKRGWTIKMIKELIRPSDYFKPEKGRMLKFYNIKNVEKVESSRKFKEFKDFANIKKNELVQEVNEGNNENIVCDKLSLDELFTKATRASIEDSYYNEFLSIISKDKMITNEFLVNYLVNEHTNLNTFQKYNKNTKRVIVDRIFTELKKLYPTLKKELDNEHTLRKNRCK